MSSARFLFASCLALVFVAGLIAALAGDSAWAQAAQTPTQAAAASTVSNADIEALVRTLQNDADRAKLVKQLQALVAAEKAQQPAPTPATTS